MNINVDIKFTNGRQWFCFKHAVQRAIQNEDIQTEIDDFGSEYDMRDTSCADCSLLRK
jgi:hypothetical protein